MDVHRFQIKNADVRELRRFTIISKIANKEGTGFFLDFKHPKPVLRNAKIDNRYPHDYEEVTLYFESEDLVEAKFKTQLSERLKTKQIIKI